MKRIAFFVSLFAAVLTACVDNSPKPDRTEFAKGADISWITEYESQGRTFADYDGNEMECTALMKKLGLNSIRLRVWVNPRDGWSSAEDVLEKALRAHKLGMRLMIDFHYSDWWADPGKQVVPAAWAELDFEGVKAALAAHTVEVLTLLKKNGIDVEWVQVGNEITPGMMCHKDFRTLEPFDNGGDIDRFPEHFAELMTAGYDAAKSVYPDTKVICHIDCGAEMWRYDKVMGVMEEFGGKYDIIGMSLYPNMYDDIRTWNETVDICIDNVLELHRRYGCDLLICEVGTPYDMAEESYDTLSYLIARCKETGCCPGVFYWEPEADGNLGYKMGAFDGGRPTKAMQAFAE